MPFESPLVVSPITWRKWRLEEEFTYKTDDGYEITVPEGFVTDFASVPRLFWNILPPYGPYGKAAVLHDYCYGKHLFERKKCDRIFRKAMKDLGVSLLIRSTLYYAVRLFGWKAY